MQKTMHVKIPKSFFGLAVAGATLASVVTTTAPATAAVLVTVGGQQYNVDVLPAGSFASNQSLLESQPWWLSSSLASDFASVVNVSLGRPNYGACCGPLFAYDRVTSIDHQRVAFVVMTFGPDLLTTATDRDSTVLSYAVATPVDVVPEPLTIIGSITAAGFGVVFKKRKKDSNKV